MKVNWYRAALAVCFLFEIGAYFGYDHLFDRSPEECVASGICMLLFSLNAEMRR